MADRIIQSETLKGIADAIRTKKETSEEIPVTSFAEEIESIEGGATEDLTAELTEQDELITEIESSIGIVEQDGTLDNPYIVQLDADNVVWCETNSMWYTFTPYTSGTYNFYSPSDDSAKVYIGIWDNADIENPNDLDEANFFYASYADGDADAAFDEQLMLVAGTTYYIALQNYGDDTGIFTISKAVDYTVNLTLDYVGDYPEYLDPLTGYYEVDGEIVRFFASSDGETVVELGLGLVAHADSKVIVYVWSSNDASGPYLVGEPECNGCNMSVSEDIKSVDEERGIKIELTNFTGNVTATVYFSG